MSDPLIIAVFGGDSPLGEVVARDLSRETLIKIRLITGRDECNQTEQTQQNGQNDSSMDRCRCNLDDVYSITSALKGSYGAFVTTCTDFTDPSCKENEIRKGRLIADACSMAGVKHVVFSTQLDAKSMLGIEVRQFDAKAAIEDYMSRVKPKLSLTYVMVPSFYEDFLGVYKPYPVGDNDFRISLPIGQAPLDMICLDDIGQVVRHIFHNRDKYIDKTVSICGDKLPVREIAVTLTTCLSPKVIKERQISVNEYKCAFAHIPGVRDIANMFYFICRVDQKYNVASTRQINPNLRSFKDWAMQNTETIHKALC